MTTPDLKSAIAAIVGPKGMIADPADMEPYLIEERGRYRGRADLVVRPATTDEAARVVAACAERGVAVTPQGGNTGLVGGGVPDGGVVLGLSRMNKVRALDPLNQTMTVEAGCVLADVQAAADAAGFLFPLSLAAEGSCQIGGNLATNAGGVNVLRYGNARDLVLGLEVVLADGRVWDGLKGLRKDNTGFDLKHLFMGSEGVLGIITAAVLKLHPKPRAIETALAAVPDPAAAIALFAKARQGAGDTLSAFEFFARRALDFVTAHIPGARDPFAEPHPCYVLLELTSPRQGQSLRAEIEALLESAFEDGLVADAVIAESGAQRQELWTLRESIPEAQKHEGGSIKHDVSVPVSAMPEFLERAGAAVSVAIPGVRICAFGHVGDGNIHFNLTEPEGADRAAYLARWDEINHLVHDIAVAMGGSFSAEHGVGRMKTGEMIRYKSQVELDLMRALKHALDPKGTLNPGKVVV